MLGKWEECVPGLPRGRWHSPQATLRPNGDISITRFTWELLDRPSHVLVLYNRVSKMIGLKPTRANITNAYKVEPYERCGGRIIRASSLVPQFYVRHERTMRFASPEIDADGILLLDLNTAYPGVPRNRRNATEKATLRILNEENLI